MTLKRGSTDCPSGVLSLLFTPKLAFPTAGMGLFVSFLFFPPQESGVFCLRLVQNSLRDWNPAWKFAGGRVLFRWETTAAVSGCPRAVRGALGHPGTSQSSPIPTRVPHPAQRIHSLGAPQHCLAPSMRSALSRLCLPASLREASALKTSALRPQLGCWRLSLKMGRRSSDTEEENRSRRKKKHRRRSSSSSSSDSRTYSRKKSGRKSRSRSRSRDVQSRSHSYEKRRRHRSSSSSSYGSRRKRSRSRSRGRGKSYRSQRSRSKSRTRRSRSRPRQRSYSRSSERSSHRRTHSGSRERERRKGREKEKVKEKGKGKEKEMSGTKLGDAGNIKAGLEHLTPAEQAKARLQLVLEAADQATLVEQVKRVKEIEAIESDSFVPQTFRSSKEVKKSVEPPELKYEPVTIGAGSVEASAPEKETVPANIPTAIKYQDDNSLAHPNLFIEKAEAEEKWFQRLIALRQERLMGSPVA
uniref:Arginine and serine rich coiled-coil 1 n=2 Tax=Meleagris gallopavo TaxID=9103 RepID=G1NDU6_MELGA